MYLLLDIAAAMIAAGSSLWSLIALAANEPEIEEIAFLIGNKRIKENEVSKDTASLTALDSFSCENNI